MFKINDHVIYAGHGVAVIDEVIERSVAGGTMQFLKLTFLFKDMTILVPMYNIAGIGLRYPSSDAAIAQALNELTLQPERRLETIDFTPSAWNRRNKEYQTKIQGGSLIDIIRIYRDLMHIAQQKDLSFGERSVLQSTEELLAQEIQVVKKVSKEHVIQLLRAPFKQFNFHDKNFMQPEVTTSTLN